jgi:alcohol dehydrogenase class IV
MNFTVHNPVKIHFGAGKISTLGTIAQKYGKKIFIATMKDIVDLGVLEKAEVSLKDAGVDCFIYPEVKPEPKSDDIDNATALIKAEGCDMVLGVGGGSCIDVAKALAICARHPEKIWSYVNLSNRPPQPVDEQLVLPIIAVPTTAGTGSEATPYSVITNTQTVQKGTVKESTIFPKEAIVDPELTLMLPPELSVLTGIDVLAHAMESYFNVPNRTPYSDLLAEEAIGLVYKHLPRVKENGHDLDARAGMAWASTLGGITISQAGTTVAHALAQPLGARLGLPHGVSVAIFLMAVMKQTLPMEAERFAKLATIFGVTAGPDFEKIAYQGIERLEQFLASIDMPPKLSHYNAPDSLIEELAEDVLTYMARPLQQHPKVFNREELCEIVRQSF